MEQDSTNLETHLTDAALFALAAPAAGEPEALPEHLSRCRECSRALQDWKAAVRDLAQEESGEIGRRTPAEWRTAEDATLDRIRQLGPPRRRARPLPWIAGLAASLVLAVLLLPGRRTAPQVAAAPTPLAASPDQAELSAADQADDDLLHQASYLASGGDVESETALEGRL